MIPPKQLEVLKSQYLADLGIVSHLGMRIEGKTTSVERHIVIEQILDSLVIEILGSFQHPQLNPW